MLTLTIEDENLEKQLKAILTERFDDDSERMLRDFVKMYSARLDRLRYSGILKWHKDALLYQKEQRDEW